MLVMRKMQGDPGAPGFGRRFRVVSYDPARDSPRGMAPLNREGNAGCRELALS